MSEHAAALEAAHTAISDLAAVLVAVRAALGGDCVRARNQLEMGEIDLLSAQDAIEKARWEIDLAAPTSGDVRVNVPRPARSIALRSAAPTGTPVSADAELPSPRQARHRAGRRRPGSPGHGQGELFPIHEAVGVHGRQPEQEPA